MHPKEELPTYEALAAPVKRNHQVTHDTIAPNRNPGFVVENGLVPELPDMSRDDPRSALRGLSCFVPQITREEIIRNAAMYGTPEAPVFQAEILGQTDRGVVIVLCAEPCFRSQMGTAGGVPKSMGSEPSHGIHRTTQEIPSRWASPEPVGSDNEDVEMTGM